MSNKDIITYKTLITEYYSILCSTIEDRDYKRLNELAQQVGKLVNPSSKNDMKIVSDIQWEFYNKMLDG